MRALLCGTVGVVLLVAGCVLDSKQVTVPYAMQPDSLVVSSTAPVVNCQVDLNRVGAYRSRKADITGVADVALLSDIRNNGLTFIRAEWWLTRDTTSYTTFAEVRANAVLLWRGPDIETRGTSSLDWNKSASRIESDALDDLLGEIRGDGAFTLYPIGAQTGTGFNFTVLDPTLVLVLDSGS